MIGIVIPTYNEAENIQKLILLIRSSLKDLQYKIIISDDNSPDGTGKIAEELSKKHPITVINRKGPRGYGEACKDGLQEALKDCEYTITMDADMSHDPKVIPFMIKEAENGYHVIIGSRYIQGGGIENWSLYRKLMSRCANVIFAKLLLGLPTNDCTSGFRLYKRKILQKVDITGIYSNGYSFIEELLYKSLRKGAKIKEVPIVYRERREGKSKLSKKEILKFFWTTFRLRFTERGLNS